MVMIALAGQKARGPYALGQRLAIKGVKVVI
jgi:hypothetical protein